MPKTGRAKEEEFTMIGKQLHASIAGLAGLLLLGTSTAVHAEGVTLTVWHNTQDPPAVLALYDAYAKASGNTINLVHIPADGFENATLTKWATGDRPDILEYHANLPEIDKFNPAQNLIDLSGEAFVTNSDIYQLGGRASDGKVYSAITTFPETWGVYYNRQLLADNGLEPASTFDELLEQCAVFSKAGITTLHQAGASLWPVWVVPLIYATAVAPDGWREKLLSREAKISDADSPFLAGFQKWVEMKEAGCYNADMTTATFEQSASDVYTGKAAYHLIHSNIAAVYLDKAAGDAAALDAAVGFNKIGASTPAITVSVGPIGSYLIPKTGDSAREAAALEFVRFITGEGYPNYIQESGTFPIIKDVAGPEGASALLQEIKAAYDTEPRRVLIGSNIPAGYPNGLSIFSQLMVGQITAEEMATRLQQDFEIAAQTMGLSGF